MRNVLLDPKDVWGYFNDHIEELETTKVLIAENEELGIDIYIDSIQGLLHVEIVQDDYTIDEDCCTNESDCENVVQNYYDHLETGYYGKEFDDDSDDFEDRELKIEDREDELDRAFFDVLSTILDDKMDFYGVDEIIEDIKDRTIEYLARKYKLRIRRPMYLEDESGDFFAEYPYEHMVYA